MSIRISGLAVVVVVGSVLLLSGCATQPAAPPNGGPGFFFGLLHGFTILFALIGSIFTDYRVYAFPNSGGFYDLGFVLGAGMFFGGMSSSR